MTPDVQLQFFVWKVLVPAVGVVLIGLAGVYVKAVMARITDKDKQLADMKEATNKQIADLIETNERLNAEKDEWLQKFIDKLNGG